MRLASAMPSGEAGAPFRPAIYFGTARCGGESARYCRTARCETRIRTLPPDGRGAWSGLREGPRTGNDFQLVRTLGLDDRSHGISLVRKRVAEKERGGSDAGL